MNLHLAAPASRSVDESRAKNGPRMEESAFRLFYEQTSTPLLRYLLGATRKRDVAEDLLQETYCRFLTTDVPEMEEREARSYLFRIATNLMHDRWRHAREDSLPERSVPDVSPAPQFERRLSVRQAFERLKPANGNSCGWLTWKAQIIVRSRIAPACGPGVSACYYSGLATNWRN